MYRLLFVINIFSISINYVSAQDCDAILRHGINNTSKKHTKEVANAYNYSKYCFNQETSDYKKVAISFGIDVTGYVDANGNYDNTRLKEAVTNWCNEHEEEYENYKEKVDEVVTLNQAAINAWAECNNLSKNNEIKIKIDPDSKSFTVSLRHTGPGTPGENGPEFYEVEEHNFTCNITPKTSWFGTDRITNNARIVSCKRINSKEGYDADSKAKYVDWPTAKVIIKTASGDIPLWFPNERVWEAGVLKKGIGEIVSSMLTVEKFTDLYNDSEKKIVWVLANGNEISEDYDYYKYISRRVPDLRGVFLRGKNHKRFDSIVPEAELGEFIEESIKIDSEDLVISGGKHQHYYLSTANGDYYDGPNFNKSKITPGYVERFGTIGEKESYTKSVNDQHSHTIKNKEPSETRPKNVTVNYFIRVN